MNRKKGGIIVIRRIRGKRKYRRENSNKKGKRKKEM